MKTVLIITLCGICSYLVVAFVELETNPLNWFYGARLLFIMMWCMSSITSMAIKKINEI